MLYVGWQGIHSQRMAGALVGTAAGIVGAVHEERLTLHAFSSAEESWSRLASSDYQSRKQGARTRLMVETILISTCREGPLQSFAGSPTAVWAGGWAGGRAGWDVG